MTLDPDDIDEYIDPADYDPDELGDYLDDIDANFGSGQTDSIINELVDNFDEAHGFIAEGDPFAEIQF